MPRPRSLTPQIIAGAALAVIEREGLPGLSMRLVAEELGRGTMSLYRYVSGRDELETLVLELVLAELDLEPVELDDWREGVRRLASRLRELVERHVALVPLLLSRRHTTLRSLRFGEALLRVLADAGLAPKQRAIAFRCVLSYVIGATQLDHSSALSGQGTAALAALPSSEFPRLAETARVARAISRDAEFFGGLELVLTGIEAERRAGLARRKRGATP